MPKCNICNYVTNSESMLWYHKREKHTFINCIETICSLCDKTFQNPNNNQKCEDCRNLQNSLNTNTLIFNTYVYNNKKRYYVNKGFVTEVCPVYMCNNDIYCDIHNNKTVSICNSTKCLRMFVENEHTCCDNCRDKNNKSKNKIRNNLIELKQHLGGQCVNCNENKLYCLEFDHIDPNKKTKQITRMCSKNWYKELDNIQLLCGNCHRIKSYKETLEKHKNVKETKSTKSKKQLVQHINKIKLKIGKCQICEWTHQDNNFLGCVMEFDHINNNKIKQVSKLCGLKARLEEIIKCRQICRKCHQTTTCLQRGGKMLQAQMSDIEYSQLYDKYMNKENAEAMNREVINVTKELFPEFFEDTFYIMEKIDIPNFEINKNGVIRSCVTKQIIKPFIYKIDKNPLVRLYSKNYKLKMLLAKMFIENPNNYKYVKNIDDNPDNIRLHNLEWSKTEKVKKVIQYTKNNIKLNEFDSIKEAAEHIKIHASCISRAISNNKSTAGYIFKIELVENDSKNPIQQHQKQPKKIVQYTKDNIKVKEFESMNDAGKFICRDSSNISRAIKNGKMSGGFLWKIE